MLIDIDVIDTEEMIINFIHRSLTFGDVLNFRTDIHVHAKDNVKARRVIKAAKDAVISSRSVIKMPIKMKEDSEPFTNNRDYLFKPDRPGGCYYLINADPTRPHKDYARCYVDDIVILFKTFKQHFEYLDTIFELFDAPITLTLDDDGLIWYIDPGDTRRRFYVSESLEKDIFAITHDNYAHTGFYRAYDRVRSALYLHRLSRRLRMYATYCPQCQTHQFPL